MLYFVTRGQFSVDVFNFSNLDASKVTSQLNAYSKKDRTSRVFWILIIVISVSVVLD